MFWKCATGIVSDILHNNLFLIGAAARLVMKKIVFPSRVLQLHLSDQISAANG